MNHFLLAPRWWAINLFVALAVPFCLFMGSWQLDRFSARVESHQEQRKGRDAPAAPLTGMLPVTTDTVGRLATATGRYDPGAEFLVPDRRLEGERGFFALSVLRTEGGAALPVVRGWLPGTARAAGVPAPPTGTVTVTGVLQAPENQRTKGVRVGGLTPGRIGIISAASLVNVVPYEVYDAWITLAETGGGLRAVPPAAVQRTGLDLKAFQNLGYTGEWFVFAGFVVFMWFRLYRREREDGSGAADNGPATVATSAAPALSVKATPVRDAPVKAGPVLAPARADSAADAYKDRTLKIAGGVLGTVFLAFVAWSGTAYLSGRDYSGELVTFEVVSDTSARAHLSVRKDTGTVVVCTLRSLSEAGGEVGRKDVNFAERRDSVDKLVELRTTGRATAVELVGCQDAAAG